MRRSCGIPIIVLGIVGGLLLVANAHTQAEDKPAGGQGALEAAAPQPGFRPKPLEIKTVYEVKERYRQAGGGPEIMKCDLSFEITNTLPIPIRIAFPPQGVFLGHQVPLAKDKNDDVPEFARDKKIVEIGPRQTVAFKTSGVFVTTPGRYEWVFGKPPEGTVPENLFIGSVYSDPVPRGIPGREPNTAAESR